MLLGRGFARSHKAHDKGFDFVFGFTGYARRNEGIDLV